jgi:hypothetical protein
MVMNWVYLALVLGAAALAAYRIWHAVRRVLAERADDWDERLVKNLRAQGGDPFSPYEIDFFFAVPTQPQCQSLADVLTTDGFVVDFRHEHRRSRRLSLHAPFASVLKRGPVARFRELAVQPSQLRRLGHRGCYQDGRTCAAAAHAAQHSPGGEAPLRVRPFSRSDA